MKKSSKAVQVGKMEEKDTVQAEKNNSIENSPEKNKVRMDCIMQVKECMAYQKLKKATVLTLPAANAYFETGLVHAFKRASLKTELSFYGVELDKKIVPDAFRSMPANSILAGYCTIENFLKYEAHTTTSGFATLTDIERASPFMFDFAWFDYCGLATKENMEHFVNCIRNNIKWGLIAVTFDLSVRLMSQNEYAKLFSGYRKGMSQREAIVATIEKMIRQSCPLSKNVSLVNNTEYGGGKSGRTTMLTLVFSVNIPSGVVTTIKENFRDGKSALKQKRLNTYNQLKYNATHRISKKAKKIGRPAKVKKVLTKEEKKAAMYAAKYQAVWKMLSAEKKYKLATKCGKNVHQLGSMIAHFHGKLAEKRSLATA